MQRRVKVVAGEGGTDSNEDSEPLVRLYMSISCRKTVVI